MLRSPAWWLWDFVFTDHLELRLEERGLSLLELRLMLYRTSSVRAGSVHGRFEAITVTAFREDTAR